MKPLNALLLAAVIPCFLLMMHKDIALHAALWQKDWDAFVAKRQAKKAAAQHAQAQQDFDYCAAMEQSHTMLAEDFDSDRADCEPAHLAPFTPWKPVGPMVHRMAGVVMDLEKD